MLKFVKPFLVVASLSVPFSNALAQPDNAGSQPTMFGKGEPASIEDLPPGPTRERLQSLSPTARARALEWLQRLEFPAADLDAMQIDDEGGVLYVDPFLPAPGPDRQR
jgi:hypothetical protein